MNFPVLTDSQRMVRLEYPARRARVVIDTDTFNEIDDQFAIVHALLSPERLQVEALYAAPFHNEHSNGPADGMERSYLEICSLLTKLERPSGGFVFRGSTSYLLDNREPIHSAAAADLVQRAMSSPPSEPLVVVAIAALSNVASAILIEPRIVERMVIVWLGGHALHWPNTAEFNLRQDVHAARLIFDCGVPLVHIPCMGVTSHLTTTVSELQAHLDGCGAIGHYLLDIFSHYESDHFSWSKVIWDMAAVAYLLNGAWVETDLVHSPILTDQLTWSFDPGRHFIRSARFVNRDPIFRDLFIRLKGVHNGENSTPVPIDRVLSETE